MTSVSTTFALIGDSDIQRWPQQLFPEPATVREGSPSSYIHSGHNGATLEQIRPHVQEVVLTALASSARVNLRLVLIVCAGENDIGQGESLASTEVSFRRLLDIVFDPVTTTMTTTLIFLGPKIEPWMVEDDADSRKQFIRMSKHLSRLCNEHSCSSRIKFINCLTIFCDETCEHPSIANASPRYFASDQLHLSADGYKIWKRTIEEMLL
jgi:lysophospholipase L1-like esterase